MMKNTNQLREGNMSRFSVRLVLALYLLVGVGIGWLWKTGSTTQDLLDAFHKWYYQKFDYSASSAYWLGAPIWKCPLDLWVYQEIIYDTKPDVLVEAGTYKGGSAYYFASMFDLLKRGRVLSIDIYEYPDRPQHERITYLLGSSTSEAIVRKVKSLIQPGEKVMVSLDSDHHKDHVLNELKLYSNVVTVGNYLVVEDTDLSGHPLEYGPWPGPMEAVEEFLKTNSNFVQDRTREMSGVTNFPGGWLKKVR
jgi:cephalosporin hydroxylase